MAKVTIAHIADALGVTPSTVSRALAGSPRVKLQTRQKVEQMAALMGYERNEMASNLRRGTAQTVGIIVPRINRQFFGSVISGAETVLNEAGYSVIISQTHESLGSEIAALKTMSRNRVAGIIISHSIEVSDGEHLSDLLSDGIRLVQFDRVYGNLPGAKVVNDNCRGAYEATAHLLAQGYRRIGTLAGHMTCGHYRDRLEGYRSALEDSGILFDSSLVFEDCILRETGHEAAMEAIRRGCDALYCAGDFSALGALDAAQKQGLEVPRDFGIVGTANEYFTGITSPSLSSLEMSPKQMGQIAARAFLENTDRTFVVPMKLIQRQSSTKNSKQP
ncbi:MAG: LacI family DNA-binding transcriptional regulator [Bacteroidales bacterium]|nr:LacI family DNA-binding transcriptional regulator [Bacteroidales bacterium]